MESSSMRPITSAALIALSLGLAACGPVNRGLESVNQPVVSRTDYVFDVSAAGLMGPSSPEAKRLAAWFDSIGLGYGDRVSVDQSAAYGDSGRDEVAALAAKHGLLLSETAPVTAGAIDPGSVRVIVSRTTAEVPNCPNWKRASQPEFAGSTMSNYGCATNRNLAAMVANPEDLVRGRTGSGTDASTAAKAIKSYRDAEPTGKAGLQNIDTKGK
jgi:pilus assembly protein CpaD